MLFSSTKTLKEWRKHLIGADVEKDDSESEGQHQISKKKNKFAVNFNVKHDNAQETEGIMKDEKGGSFEFTKSFVCLGSTLNFLLSDSMMLTPKQWEL